MHQDLRNLRIPPSAPRSKHEKMIATLNGIRKEAVTTSLLLIIITVFVWAFGPWQRRDARDAATSRDDASAAVRAAESFGFTDVRILRTRHTGGALSPCDENDAVMHNAVASNPRGTKEVLLLICCNATNNCTIKTR